MNLNLPGIPIIPDFTVDQKYSAIIEVALKRLQSFTESALKGGRLHELFVLEKSRIDAETAQEVLASKGRLLVAFQFEARPEQSDNNFRVFVKKSIDKDHNVKFYLNPTVQEIMLQLISLEDRRTVAIFSMLNSSLEIGYRILTTLYANQLRRLLQRAPQFVRPGMADKLTKLEMVRGVEDAENLLQTGADQTKPAGPPAANGNRPGSEENILQVMADEATLSEINQYVTIIESKAERFREKRLKIEENPDMPLGQLYENMVREDLGQLENCYARMHIYLRAFYKNQKKRTPVKNKILRQFFGGEIEKITGETGQLEDMLSLKQDDYFKAIDRHKER